MPSVEKIGIILATYNPNLEYFHKQIDSIKNQTWQNWVCHIVDDCSQLEYQESITKLIAHDPRFIYHCHNCNLNYYYNFERGLQYCAEDKTITAISSSDQDDIWYSDKLSILLGRLRCQQAVLIHSDLEMINSDDQLINSSTWDFEGRNPEQISVDFLLLRNVVTGCSMLFCSSLLSDILPFPPQDKIKWYHDWWIAIVAAQKGKIEHIRQPLVKYRIHDSNNVGVIKDSGKFYREFLVWLSKSFRITGDSYLVHRNLSQAFYTRFQQDLDSLNWSNPFDDVKLDFGYKIIKLCVKSLKLGYNSEGIALRIFICKILFDIQKLRKCDFSLPPSQKKQQ